MKLLIISHNSFSANYNNGKTLSSIFSAFKKEELCQLFFTPLGSPDFSRCNDYYCITDIDAIKSIIFRNSCGSKDINKYTELSTTFASIKKNHSSIKLFIRSIIWALSSWYNGGLCTWLKNESPDAIFYVGGNSIFSHKIANFLSKRLQIPLVTYFTDDYVLNSSQNWYTKLLKYQYNITLKNSCAIFAIGTHMANEYSRHFNKKVLPIMNIVDIPRNPYAANIKEIIHINYFGGLHLGRGEQIVRFASLIDTHFPNSIKNRIIISVYSFQSLSQELVNQFKKYSIHKKGGVSGKNLVDEMKKTDVFLHVESIEKQYINLTKLSVSTKIPEYMSFSKPIIAFGPSEVASFRLIGEVNPDLVIDDDNSRFSGTKLLQIMECILSNQDKYREFGQRNYIYAKEHFNRYKIAHKFRTQLLAAISCTGNNFINNSPSYVNIQR